MASRSKRRFSVVLIAIVSGLIVALFVAVGMGWIGYFGPIPIPR